MTSPVRGLSELVLLVHDVARAVEFYRNVVGLELERPADESWAWFVLSAAPMQRLAVHRGSLLFEEHSPHPAGHRFGPVHCAFEVDRSALDAAVARVRDAGVAVHGPTRLEWMRATSWYFYDPDGNLLEFWSPDP